MFTITIHFHMADTVTLRDDNPLTVLSALKMSAVSHVEITSNKGD